MSFDGFFLKNIIDEICPQIYRGKIESITQIKSGFIMSIYNNKESFKLIFNVLPESSSLYITNKEHNKNDDNKILGSFLENITQNIKHSIITNIKQFMSDRIIIFELEHNDFLLGVIKNKLIFEVFGKKANLILVDNKDTIINVYKRDINYLGRTFLPKAEYHFPKSDKIELIDKIDYSNIFDAHDIMNKYLGVGIEFANYLFHNKINNIDDISIVPVRNKKSFYCANIYDEIDKKFPTLSNLLDDVNDVQQNTENKITKYILLQIKKLNSKLDSLNQSVSNSSEYDDLVNKARILQNYSQYYNDYLSEIDGITLDSTKTLVQNIDVFFKKAKKAKNSLVKIEEQVKVTQDKLLKLEEIHFNYTHVSSSNDPEITKLLAPYGYLKNHEVKKNAKKPLYIHKQFSNVSILIGKNSVQNEELIKTKNKEWWWFHVKDASGAHLIYCDSEISDEAIRYCAIEAAKLSSLVMSSSIPVNYTKLKYIKKIANISEFKVSIKEYKTIYVDIL